MKKKILTKILIFIGIITLILSFSFVAPKTKASSWYTPDLEDYTFNIEYDDDSLIFKANELISGDFYAFLMRDEDFSVFQNLAGALDFSNIRATLIWVAGSSLMGDKYGLTPMSFLGLPSYVSYNIYNNFNPLEYKGAVNIHTVIYRLDFNGNYGMKINNDIYDSVYSFEVIYELKINYTFSNYVLNRGYKIYWYSRSYMREFDTYIEMNNDTIHFELISDNELTYEKGFSDGYDSGYSEGYNLGYDEGIMVGESEAYQKGFKDGENSKLAKNNTTFYAGIEKWLVPAIITVIVLGGIVSIAAIKRREQ